MQPCPRPEYAPQFSFNAFDALRAAHAFMLELKAELGNSVTLSTFDELMQPLPGHGTQDPAYWLDWLEICVQCKGLASPAQQIYPDWRYIFSEYDLAGLRLDEREALQCFLRLVQDRVTRMAFTDLIEVYAQLDVNLYWLPGKLHYWEQWLTCCKWVSASGEIDVEDLLNHDGALMEQAIAADKYKPEWAQ